MKLTDPQIGYFVDNPLRLPKGKRTEYLAQVDRLIEKFAAAAKEPPQINLYKLRDFGTLDASERGGLRPLAIGQPADVNRDDLQYRVTVSTEELFAQEQSFRTRPAAGRE